MDTQGEKGGEGEDGGGGHLPVTEPRKFGWDSHWLRGDEYRDMLINMDLYCKAFGFRKYPQKSHPQEIYTQPQNGMVYFVKARSIGTEFGFPRVQCKKQYRWKKMNFRTDLPKKEPLVTYIVASAVRCERQATSSSHASLFRMHVVMLYRREHQDQSYVLCHIRQLDIMYQSRHSPETRRLVLHSDTANLQQCLVPSVNYLSLFRLLHNLNQAQMDDNEE